MVPFIAGKARHDKSQDLSFMPQLVIILGVGAGLVAGYKWLSREVQRQQEMLRRRAEEQRTEEAGGAARDLGELEWDETAGAYRPKR